MVNLIVALISISIGFWLGYRKGTKNLAQHVDKASRAAASLYRPAMNRDYQYVVTEVRTAFEETIGLEPDPQERAFSKAADEYHDHCKNGTITETEEHEALRLAHLILEKTLLMNRLRELKGIFKKNDMDANWDLGDS